MTDMQRQIDRLKNEKLRDLRLAFDHCSHTFGIWRDARRGFELAPDTTDRHFPDFFNPTNGKTPSKETILVLMDRYATDLNYTSTFLRYLTVFEEFFFSFLRLWLMRYPESLSKKQLGYGEMLPLLRNGDIETIHFLVVDKELNEIKYRSLDKWFEYLQERTGVAPASSEDIGRLAEMKAARDILVHNEGIVNRIYLVKSGDSARFNEGQRIRISETYLKRVWTLVKSLIRGIAEQRREDRKPPGNG